jgi:YjbE family integral membrane protein
MEMLFDLVRIMTVNLVLSGDNAVVIAMCCRALPENQRMKAMLWGSAGAIGLRFFMTMAATYLLDVPYLGFIGGLLLVWIAAKLLDTGESTDEVNARNSFLGAVKTILVADVVMSLDNTLAIAAVARGDVPMLLAGFGISIPVIIFGSRLVMSIMERFPVVVYAGAVLIAWTAGDLIVHDQRIGGFILAFAPNWVANLCAVGILTVIGCWKSKTRRARLLD